MNTEEQDNLLLRMANIFLRCFLLTYALLLLWFVLFMLAGDWAYSISARWFEVSKRDFTLVNYLGIVFTKICAFIFFLFPYVSIKLVLRKKRRNT
jgi:hypothetical protein